MLQVGTWNAVSADMLLEHGRGISGSSAFLRCVHALSATSQMWDTGLTAEGLLECLVALKVQRDRRGNPGGTRTVLGLSNDHESVADLARDHLVLLEHRRNTFQWLSMEVRVRPALFFLALQVCLSSSRWAANMCTCVRRPYMQRTCWRWRPTVSP